MYYLHQEKIASEKFEQTMGQKPTRDELKAIMGLTSRQRNGSSWSKSAKQITKTRRRLKTVLSLSLCTLMYHTN